MGLHPERHTWSSRFRWPTSPARSGPRSTTVRKPERTKESRRRQEVLRVAASIHRKVPKVDGPETARD